MVISIRNTDSVRCREAVRFSEGPLSEVRLYLSLFYVLWEAVHVIHTLFVVYAIPEGQCNELI